jgi:hypothetical protein
MIDRFTVQRCEHVSLRSLEDGEVIPFQTALLIKPPPTGLLMHIKVVSCSTNEIEPRPSAILTSIYSESQRLGRPCASLSRIGPNSRTGFYYDFQ